MASAPGPTQPSGASAGAATEPWPLRQLGDLGRTVLGLGPALVSMLQVTGACWKLLLSTLYYSTVAPIRGQSKLRENLFTMATNVGVRSLIIVCLVAMLIGAILVLQTGETIDQFGQINEVPGLVALSMTRALGPLMTAVVLISRVGASYTAVLGSMNINEEVVALRTMAINPVGYLVAPRFVSMVLMTPLLVCFAYLLGCVGGGVVAWPVYDIPPVRYIDKTFEYLTMMDLISGLLKSVVFAALIAIISCYYGLAAKGGPTGLGRNIMVSVVTCLVVIVLADAILTAFVNQFLL